MQKKRGKSLKDLVSIIIYYIEWVSSIILQVRILIKMIETKWTILSKKKQQEKKKKDEQNLNDSVV